MPNSNQRTRTLKFFCSYSHKDDELRIKLQDQLELLEVAGLISQWDDGKIGPGEAWRESIDQNLISADVILLLVSPNFTDSDYCYKLEMKQAIERHDAGCARVIPVLLRDTKGLQDTPFAKLQMVPTSGVAVASSGKLDDAIRDVAKEISAVVPSLMPLARTASQHSPPKNLVEIEEEHCIRLYRKGQYLYQFPWKMGKVKGSRSDAAAWKKLHTITQNLYEEVAVLLTLMQSARVSSEDKYQYEAQGLIRALPKRIEEFTAELPQLPLAAAPVIERLQHLPDCVTPIKLSLGYAPDSDEFNCAVVLTERIGAWLLQVLRIADGVLEKYFRRLA